MKKYKIVFAFFFGLQTMLEIFAINHRALWCEECVIGSWKYFLLYNTGNINNSAGLLLILWAICSIIRPKIKSKIWITLIPATITTFIFIWIERNDLMDIPFAIIGILITLPVVFNKQFKIPLLIYK